MTKKDETPGATTSKAPDEGQQTTAIQKQTNTPSERFTAMVMKHFAGLAGAIPELTGYQKRLIQNYFISTDMALKAAEDKRLKKSKNQDPISVTWDNVNLEDLSMNVVAFSKIGLDPAISNHLSMIPYKNNKTGKYDIGFLEGYRGKELKARKYGFDVPDNVIVEVVYSNDTFKPLKKDSRRDIESFEFSISDNPFDRGDIVGGFYYHEYYGESRKNKLMFYNLSEILKRKPEYASPEFWGGEKDKWENGQKVGKEKVEGWFAEMIWKTLFRMAYNIIPIDGEKIDDNLMRLLEHEKYIETVSTSLSLEGDRDRQISQGTGTKSISSGTVNYQSADNSRKAIPTDVSFEDVSAGPENQTETSQGQPSSHNTGPSF